MVINSADTITAGKMNMEGSYFMSKGKTMEQFPLLKDANLRGSLVYYDGQHNDSRMNMALIMTAVHQGAVVANHTEVVELYKNSEGQCKGARIRDNISGEEWDVKAKVYDARRLPLRFADAWFCRV